MILLASVLSGILAMWPNRERRRAWRGCPIVRLTSSFCGAYKMRAGYLLMFLTVCLLIYALHVESIPGVKAVR